MSEDWMTVKKLFGGDNQVLRGDGFYVSYNPHPGAGFSLFLSDEGSDETALCKDGAYYILNGDFRDSYERLVPQGFNACKKFYDQQSAHADSSWTSGAPKRADA